jgi:hypothetical protein
MIRKPFAPFLLLPLLAGSAAAQELAGDWEGILQAGPAQLLLVLHVTGDSTTGYRGTFDSPDQNALGTQVGAIAFDGSRLTFTLPQVGGSFEGTMHESGATIAGLWSQGGNSLPLELERRTGGPPPPRVPSPGELDGVWSGSIPVQGQSLELIVRVTTYEDGLGGTLDVPAQNAQGLPITLLTRDGANIHLEMRQLAAVFDGTLNADGTSISGTWGQPGFEAPLVLRKAAGEG